MNKFFSTLLLICLTLSLHAVDTQSIIDNIDASSVGVINREGYGSGVLFTRKDSTGTNDITFLWSVGHVFEQNTNETISTNITSDFKIYTNGLIAKLQSVNGVMVTNLYAYITMIKYSPSVNNDLSLSIVMATNQIFKSKTEFDLSGTLPKLGQTVYADTAADGEIGTFSIGNIESVGRIVSNYYYDETTCVIFPGSSGGGIFNTNGKCIGIVNMMSHAGMNYFIPIRRIQDWAKAYKCEWALDSTFPIPPTKTLIPKLVRINR